MSVPPNIVATPDFNTGPRHPNDAAPGRISKGGSLLTGGYLAHKVYVGNLPDRQVVTLLAHPCEHSGCAPLPSSELSS